MMMIFSAVVIAALSALNNKSNNPVKTSMGVLLTGILMFYLMSLNTGFSWIPVLMAMLFMGGIIMMFMILSSVLPNEKSMKIKLSLSFLVMMIFLMWGKFWSTESSAMSSEAKSYILSGYNFLVMMTLIMMYFLLSMSMLSSEQTPMRSVMCY